jgi:hypothetical protein
MATYQYPEARELREISPALMADITKDDFIFSVFPITESNATMLEWSVEDDDFGLQQLRGLDGAPVHVVPTGETSYVSEPGYFGEYETITERELTLRAGSVVGESVVDISDLVARKNRQLLGREVTRIRQILWTLVTTGTFSISGKGSTLTHTDTFLIQTDTGSDWSTASTATPLADFRDVQQLGAEHGVEFNSSAVAVMNRVTANRMFANTNASDLGGMGFIGVNMVTRVTGPEAANSILTGEGLPTILVYDKGYKNDSGTFTKFVADDKVVYFGTRNDGDRIGEYRMTRNLVNPGGAPGSYQFVKDYCAGINAPKQVPPKIEVHRGHSGGPILTRPKAIVVQSV